MKFTCLKESLSKSLGIVAKAIPVKSSFPILSNVLLTAQDNRVRLAGTNLDTTIVTYIAASVDEEGAITVPARLLAEYLSHLSADNVVVSLKDDTLHLSSDKAKSKFNGVPSTDFPDLPEIKKGLVGIDLDPRAFSEAVSQVVFAVASDDTRPIFSGVLLKVIDKQLIVVGCDGFRLSEKTIALKNGKKNGEHKPEDFSVVVPAKTLAEVSRIFGAGEEGLELYVDSDANICIFRSGDTFVATRVLNGEYPDYARVIPQDTEISATFVADDLFEAVKLTHVFAKDTENTLKMTIDPAGKVKIASAAGELGENNTEFSAEIEGEALEIHLNAKYLLDLLTNAKFDKLVFSASGPTNPCLIKPVDVDGYLHVMTPIHITT